MESFLAEIVNKAIGLHKQGKFEEAALIYNSVLNRIPDDEQVLYLMGDLYSRMEHNGLSINLYKNLLRKNPKHAAGWCNLGVAHRKENSNKEALNAWKKAIDAGGKSPEVCNNMATLYADTGCPKKAIEWSDEALKLDADFPDALWQKSLALLSMKQYKEGFKLYENRFKLDSWDRRDEVDVPVWDGKPIEHLYLHGEQGVGDEVMFLSHLKKAAEVCTKITLELNPKVKNIAKYLQEYKSSIANVVTEATKGDYDAKLPIGSLMHMYGLPSGEKYIHPEQERVKYYRDELKKLGKGPYVALCWFGGTKATRVIERSVPITQLKQIVDNYTCVSAQYNNDNPHLEQDRLEMGLPFINKESCGRDLAEQAALFAAVDAVVTVQQTAVHVAGSVGVKTFVMVPERPQWRYGLEGDNVPWYNSVKLYRKESDKQDWSKVIKKIKWDLDANIR